MLCLTRSIPLSAQIKIGAEVFFQKNFSLVEGKRVGVVCNSSSIVQSHAQGKRNFVDVCIEKNINITAIFSPEHGFRGNISAGETIENQMDSATGIPIFSLYGKTLHPTNEMLNKIDILIFDVQDVGARYFTYVSTMANCMEAAAKQNVPFIILDRPNPIGGNAVEGFLLEKQLQSFVGKFPVPNRHGLTLGEFAKMIVGEQWIMNSEHLDLKIIPCENYEREMFWSDTKLQWISPSPNIVSLSTALVYAGTCLLEGTNMSEGRGTEFPFQTIGAPWIESKQLLKEISSEQLNGIQFSVTEFTPLPNTQRAISPKFAYQLCNGIFLEVTDEKKFEPLATAITLLVAVQKLFSDSLRFNEKQFDRLAGTGKLREAILSHKSAKEISAMWKIDANAFGEMRKKYLLYE